MTSEVTANTEEKQKKPQLYKPGQSGNPEGKKPGTKNYLTLLEEALEKQAKIEGKTYWEKLAQWSFRNPTVAVNILKKYIPDKNQTEITGAEPIEITIKHESTS